MTKAETVHNWCRLYKQSVLRYEMNSLLSVLESDGEEMLAAVLKELGLTRSLDLVKDASSKTGRKTKASPSESPTKEEPTPL